MIGTVLEALSANAWLVWAVGLVLAGVWLVQYATGADAEDATAATAGKLNSVVLGAVASVAVFVAELGELVPAIAELIGQYGGTAGQVLIGLLGWVALKTGAFGASAFLVGAATIVLVVYALRGLTS